MKKSYLISAIVLISLIILFFLVYRYYNDKKITYLYDYRFTYSAKYRVKANSDFQLIQNIINNLKLDSDKRDDSKRIGGFMLIEKHKEEIIETYRVQGSYVTKRSYKESKENLISTTYFRLDEKYSQLLSELCDKLGKSDN